MSHVLRAGALAWAAVVLAGVAAAADNQVTPREKAAGWVLLFDGKTYAGWEDPTKKSPPGDSFTIEDGCLKATSHPRITEDLFTKNAYGNFELEFAWKISPRGNSGVKYRIQDRVFLRAEPMPRFEDVVNASMKDRRADRPAEGQDYVIGFEYQITDNGANPDAVGHGAMHQAGALYDMFAARKDATLAVGEFNQARIVVKGDHFEHWLNGQKVAEGSLKSPAVAKSVAKRWGTESPVYHLLADQPKKRCPISLQNHGDEAWFKNIRVRELK